MVKLYHVDLTDLERVRLSNIIKKRVSTSEAVKRSLILMAADRNGDKKWNDTQIAKTYLVSSRTVERLRERLVNEGLDFALAGKPRPNTDKIIFDGEVEAKLLALRCSEPIDGRSSWNLRLLASTMVELSIVDHISHESVRKLLKKRNKALASS